MYCANFYSDPVMADLTEYAKIQGSNEKQQGQANEKASEKAALTV